MSERAPKGQENVSADPNALLRFLHSEDVKSAKISELEEACTVLGMSDIMAYVDERVANNAITHAELLQKLKDARKERMDELGKQRRHRDVIG